jgi:hypothetical protein
VCNGLVSATVLAPVQFTKYIAESAMISLDPMNQALLKHPKVSQTIVNCCVK